MAREIPILMDAPLLSVETRFLSDAAILQLWDVAETLAPAQRSLEILRCSLSDEDFSRICQAPLGHANRVLLRIRQHRFGSRFHVIDRCRHCAETIEFTIATEAMLEGLRPPPPEDRRTLRFQDWTLHLHPLCPLDWIEPMPDSSPEEHGRRLMARTLLACDLNQTPAAPSDLPEPAWEAIARFQHEWDPAAEMLFQLRCPACQNSWESSLDPGAYLWLELAGQARILQTQVHTLASAYGWGESEILALSAKRRAAYVVRIINGTSPALTTLPRPARQIPA